MASTDGSAHNRGHATPMQAERSIRIATEAPREGRPSYRWLDGAGWCFVLIAVAILQASETRGQQWNPSAPGAPSDLQQLDADEPAAQAPGGESDDLLKLADAPLETLAAKAVVVPSMSQEITSVTRTAQPISRTASAVYVITNEMIRRTGARNVPEVLRTAPGVDVARVNSGQWAISIRGFRGAFSDKLLIQIDGVAVYSPLHSGTFWERDLVMLEDVDRIEIIRGPGATVWGANAVNGIINIVTKSATETHGLYADVGGGTEHRQFSDARVGGRSGNIHYRAWGLNIDDGPGAALPPSGVAGPYDAAGGGFRVDWTPNPCDTLTVQGVFSNGASPRSDANSSGDPGAMINPGGPGAPGGPGLPGGAPGTTVTSSTTTPMDFQTSTFLTRWRREIDDETDWAVQLYYYNNCGTEPSTTENVSTFDVDFQFHKLCGDHDLVCGFEYRNSDEALLLAESYYDTEQIISYFVQDTITLVDDRLFATFGIKLDHNSVTDFDYQPTARLAWTPDQRTSLWTAVSRAVRTPSLFNRTTDTATYKVGEEDVICYEAGLRRQPSEKFFWEASLFFSRYNDLIVREQQVQRNLGDADTYGFEWDAKYQLTPTWHLAGSYSFLVEDVKTMPNYEYPMIQVGGSPRNKVYFQSGWDLWENVSLDLMLRYVDSLKTGVPSYVEGDVRVAWRPTRHVEVSVVGRNLFDDRHLEFNSGNFYASEVQREVYGTVAWRY